VLRQGGDGGAQGRPIICLRNVSLKFRSARGEVAALAGVDLDVRAGEFVTVVGPSGCGK
jgi:ABC-type dipeptide/oligopeptide/nickel transport system ATPase component